MAIREDSGTGDGRVGGGGRVEEGELWPSFFERLPNTCKQNFW